MKSFLAVTFLAVLVLGVRFYGKGPAGPSAPSELSFQALPEASQRRITHLFLTRLYQALLDRDPSARERGEWLNALQRGATFEGVLRGLGLGREYRMKRSHKSAPGEELAATLGLQSSRGIGPYAIMDFAISKASDPDMIRDLRELNTNMPRAFSRFSKLPLDENLRAAEIILHMTFLMDSEIL